MTKEEKNDDEEEKENLDENEAVEADNSYTRQLKIEKEDGEDEKRKG